MKNLSFANVKIYEGSSCNNARMIDPSTRDISAILGEINENDIKFETENSIVTIKPEIYPNPATNVINVDLAQSSAEAAQISIIDMYGKVIRQHNSINEYNVALDIADLTAGIYLVKVENGGETTVEKVVVN